MKKTVASMIVAKVIYDNWKPAIDVGRCHSMVDAMCSSMPEIKAETIEEANALVKRVMEWEKTLSTKTLGNNFVNRNEVPFVIGLFSERYNAMHLAVEQLLFDMGLVESGETDTQASDT